MEHSPCPHLGEALRETLDSITAVGEEGESRSSKGLGVDLHSFYLIVSALQRYLEKKKKGKEL